jgi:hypothetical protein
LTQYTSDSERKRVSAPGLGTRISTDRSADLLGLLGRLTEALRNCDLPNKKTESVITRYVCAFFLFAQDAFIFTDKAFFWAADMGLRFAADAGIAAAFAVLPAAFRFAAQ